MKVKVEISVIVHCALRAVNNDLQRASVIILIVY